MIRYTARYPNIEPGTVPRDRPAPPPALRRGAVETARLPGVEISEDVRRRIRENTEWRSDARLYEILVDVATRGCLCPGNKQICELLDLASTGTAARLVSALEAAGRIRVTRYNAARVVEIVATGQRTAMPKGKQRPHWRLR